MTTIYTIFTAILWIIASAIALALVFAAFSIIVQAYNIRKYGCWWEKLPTWLIELMDLF